MPNRRCLVCGASSSHVTVFGFPSDTATARRWQAAVGHSRITSFTGVCAKHFDSSQITAHKNRTRLATGAVPSIELERQPSSPAASVSCSSSTPAAVSTCSASELVSCSSSTPAAVPSTSRDDSTSTRSTRRRPGTAVRVSRRTHGLLKSIQEQRNYKTLSRTIAIIAKQYLLRRPAAPRLKRQAHATTDETTPKRPLPLEEGQAQFLTPSSVATYEPPENTVPYSPSTQCSFTPGSAAPTPRRNLAEAEMLEELDIDLEVADEYSEDELEVTDVSGLEDDANLKADDPVGAIPHWDVRSAVVSEPQLRELLAELPSVCQQCRHEVPPDVSRESLSYRVTWNCTECGSTVRKPWHSTEKEGQKRLFDVLFAAATTLSGCSPAGVRKLLAFCNMGTLSSSSYYRIANKIIYPVIDKEYEATINANRTEALAASPGGLVVAGDCQNDSPGYSASYGTYTLMDHGTGRIVAQHWC